MSEGLCYFPILSSRFLWDCCLSSDSRDLLFSSPSAASKDEAGLTFDWHLTFSTSSPLTVALVRRVSLCLLYDIKVEH
jgi:hypothetical protein